MKRSEINAAIADARLAFEKHHWVLPEKWDVTGFGLDDFQRKGIVLVNLTELPEYCEKVMFGKRNQVTIMHCHKKKQEDIIARVGIFAIRLASSTYTGSGDMLFNLNGSPVHILLNGVEKVVDSGSTLFLHAGERITLFPGVFHEFWPVSEYAIIGEVSTANDDVHDNIFVDKYAGRFEAIEEDEAPLERLLNE